MKNDKTLYRYFSIEKGHKVYQHLHAQQLHQLMVKKYWQACSNTLGRLKEQTETFASHIASLHLCAMRYAMLVYAKAQNNNRVCDMRRNVEEQLTLLSYGKKLWGLFRFLIQLSLNEIQDELDGKVKLILDTLDKNILNFFKQALQLDQRTLDLESAEQAIL